MSSRAGRSLYLHLSPLPLAFPFPASHFCLGPQFLLCTVKRGDPQGSELITKLKFTESLLMKISVFDFFKTREERKAFSVSKDL